MIGIVRRIVPASGSPAWVAAETLGSAAFSLVGLLFIARLIGPQAAGTGAIAASAFLTIDFPIAALFGDALLQRRDLEERHRSSALWVTIGVALLGMIGLFLAAPLIAGAIGAPVLTDMIHVLSLLLPFSAASGLMAALALRARHYRLLAQRVLICQPLSVGAGMVAAFAGWGPWAMVVQQAVATLSVFLLLAALSGWRPRLVVDRAAIADLWPIAGPQILALLVLNGRYRIFILVLGMMVAETVVAVTHIAFRLLDVAMSVVSGASSRLAMPRLSALQHDRDAMAECYGDLAQLQALIGLPIAIGLAITAPQLITLLMGGPWVAAAEPARLVALAAVPAFLIGPAPALWLALGRTRMNLITQLIGFCVPLMALLIVQPVDAAGAAVCWVGGTLSVVPLQVILGLRALNRPLRWLVGQLTVPIVATAAMTGVALFVAEHVAGKPALMAISLIGGCGAATYCAMLAVLLGGRWPRALREA
ncbi:oligosaccharide flippase family protein [Belnapia rosea]|uniref:Membrane protein involved in the export of O-antigen and teichoic acid n=1 Tax=Belnapia rosea TaxID=938405 RepID=A0A1G6U7X6_9PROT|nr:oligosaccharide flippase family protein [Belnapia rosea]SDB08066.1 Membrane protein involved in the export of O-antigen and teichoic acid [Belnapia rosea]SDD36707.1 Membrane protein involved in the export of O-antigen and teichoic acid [Belnapia rosea]